MPPRISDAWLALGLGLSLLVGLKVVAAQIHRGEKLNLLEAERLQTIKTGRKTQTKVKSQQEGRSDNDVPLHHLETLVRHSNLDIRRAATEILLCRFLAQESCMQRLRSDYTALQDRKSKGQDTGDFDAAAAVYDLAGGFDIAFPSRTHSFANLATHLRSTSNASRPIEGDAGDLDGFIRENREVLGRFIEQISEDDQGQLTLAIHGTVTTEQSPEEVAQSHWQRREAVVVESAESSGRLQVFWPPSDTSSGDQYSVDDSHDGDDAHSLEHTSMIDQ